MRRTGLRSVFAIALGVLVAGGCSASKVDGTDSSTHWTYCKTTADCPGARGAYACREGHCVDMSLATSDSGVRGNAAGGSPATGGSVAVAGGSTGMPTPSAGGVNEGQGATGGGGRSGVAPSRDAGAAAGGRAPSPSDSGTSDARVPGALTACVTNSDCALVNATCCGVCGEPGASDKTAVNASHVEDWYRSVCGDGACPTCAALDGPYEAFCEEGQCVVKNIGQEKECLREEDCAVRPKDCCPCGDLGRSDIVAVNSSEAYPACTVSCSACPGGAHYPALQAHCFLSGGYCILE